VGGVVVTHGNLAAELVNAAEMIVRDLHHVTAVTIGWHDTLEEAREQIGQAIEPGRSGSRSGRADRYVRWNADQYRLYLPWIAPRSRLLLGSICR
jgi:hypothetical protein